MDTRAYDGSAGMLQQRRREPAIKGPIWGELHDSNHLGSAMDASDEGWTYIMSGNLSPGEQNSPLGTLLNGRPGSGIDGSKIDLGTLGGRDSWIAVTDSEGCRQCQECAVIQSEAVFLGKA